MAQSQSDVEVLPTYEVLGVGPPPLPCQDGVSVSPSSTPLAPVPEYWTLPLCLKVDVPTYVHE